MSSVRYEFQYGDAHVTVNVEGVPTPDLRDLIGVMTGAVEDVGGTVTENHVTEGEAVATLGAY